MDDGFTEFQGVKGNQGEGRIQSLVDWNKDTLVNIPGDDHIQVMPVGNSPKDSQVIGMV